MLRNRLMKKVVFEDIIQEWLDLQKTQVKESTYATYFNHIQNHIKPYFKDIYLIEITNSLIQQFINDKLKSGRLNKTGGLSIKSVKELVNVIKLVIKYSVENKYIQPISLEFKFPIQRKQLQILNNDEYMILSQYLKDNKEPFSIGILLILCTGIRIGELCALKNQDIDLKRKEIYIHKTLQRIQDIENKTTKIIISSTKTIKSTRIIPIPESLIPYIKTNDDQNYFLTQSNKYIEPRTVRYKFKRIIKKLQITEVTVHSLRHYFASYCIELGFDYNCLSEILGHSSPATTMNLYVHSKNEYKKRCMNKIQI